MLSLIPGFLLNDHGQLVVYQTYQDSNSSADSFSRKVGEKKKRHEIYVSCLYVLLWVVNNIVFDTGFFICLALLLF